MDREQKKPFQYKAYGMNIDSELELEELLPGDGPPEVFIRKEAAEVINQSYMQFANPISGKCPKVILNLSDTARYEMEHGRSIRIFPDIHADMDSVRMHLMSSAFSVLLYQRGSLPIHGSSLLVNRESIIVTGLSGAGKSTLCAFMRKQGIPFLGDDLATIRFSASGNTEVHPGYPQQKLWKDSMHVMEESLDCRRVSNEYDKYRVPAAEQFHNNPARLSALFELIPDHSERVWVEEITGMRKVEVLVRNTYRNEFINRMGLAKDHFEQCAKTAEFIRCYRLHRPEFGYTLKEQMDAVLSALEKHKGDSNEGLD